MAKNEGTLVNLEEEKQFLFNYRKMIRRFKFIRRGSKRQAIVCQTENQTVRSKSLRKAHERGDRGREDTVRLLVLFGRQRQYFAMFTRYMYYYFIFCQSEGSLLL